MKKKKVVRKQKSPTGQVQMWKSDGSLTLKKYLSIVNIREVILG